MRLTKEQRILNAIKNLNLDDDCIELMRYLLSISDHGSIPQFAYRLDEARKKVFADNHSRFVNAYKNLLETGFIAMQATTLTINAWQKPSLIYQTQINTLHYTMSGRKYTRIIDDQIHISAINGIDGNKGLNVANKSEEKFVWKKVKGITVPRSLAGLFTRKIYDWERTRLDAAWLLKEEDRRMLDKEEIRFLCGLLAQCNTYGQINDYNTHYSIRAMKELFEDESFAVSTGYRVQKELQGKDIISIYTDRKTGRQILNINGYKEGFGKGKNYVVIPYAVFRTVFKKLELPAINLFFQEVFQLNNGENGHGGASAHKKVKLKMLAAGMDTGTDKEKLASLRAWLRKRNDSEIFRLLRELAGSFFDIEYTAHGVIAFKLKQIYFVLKDAIRKTIFDPMKRYKRKAAIINECLDAYSIEYKKDDLNDLVMVLSRAAARVIRRIMKALAIDIRSRKQNNRPGIRSIGAYVSSLYKQYLAGTWSSFSGTIAYMDSLRREALDKLSEN